MAGTNALLANALFLTSGDRHMSNILVHKKTGEVIHIDFGVVFEQGMVRGFVCIFALFDIVA